MRREREREREVISPKLCVFNTGVTRKCKIQNSGRQRQYNQPHVKRQELLLKHERERVQGLSCRFNKCSIDFTDQLYHHTRAAKDKLLIIFTQTPLPLTYQSEPEAPPKCDT